MITMNKLATMTCSLYIQVTLIFTDFSFGCSSFLICFLCSLCCSQRSPACLQTHTSKGADCPHLPLACLLRVIFQHHLLLFLPFLLLPTSLSRLHRMHCSSLTCHTGSAPAHLLPLSMLELLSTLGHLAPVPQSLVFGLQGTGTQQ